MPYTLRPSPHAAGRRPVWRSPAASVAGRGLASPGADSRWLPAWPQNPLAPLTFDGKSAAGSWHPSATSRIGLRAPAMSCDQLEAVQAALHRPGRLCAGSGVVDTVAANSQPHHDRFACDLCQPEQRPAAGSCEAPGHRVVRADPVHAQRPGPRRFPFMGASIQRGTKNLMHGLHEQLAGPPKPRSPTAGSGAAAPRAC